jgi:hypothetical protein
MCVKLIAEETEFLSPETRDAREMRISTLVFARIAHFSTNITGII